MADPKNVLSQRQCKHCGGPIPLSDRRGQKSLYCKPACRLAAFQRRRRQDRLLLTKTRPHEWFSPPEIVEAARQVMGHIDLDPASCEDADKIIRAGEYYDEAADGLAQPWFGRIWLNPPYGYLAPKFVARFSELYSNRHTEPKPIEQAILLLNAQHMNARWFLALTIHHPIICLPTGRLRFSGSKTDPTHASVLLGVGVNAAAFKNAFSCFGQILQMA